MFSAQSLPIQYYLYFLMPLFLWWYALLPLDIWVCTFRGMKRNRSLCMLWIEVISYILGCLAMVTEMFAKALLL